jgi:hypothetical protein
MSELRPDPTPQQLFDRILRLEAEVARLKLTEISALKAENESIKTAIHGLWEALKSEVANTTEHFGDIRDYLWPLVHKVFPRVADDHLKIARIIKPGGAADGGKPPA